MGRDHCVNVRVVGVSVGGHECRGQGRKGHV